MTFQSDAAHMFPEGLAFDDVLLVPDYSEILPQETELFTKFSRNIPLNLPVVSAAMDTVTESDLAIAIAREGGIGVIHKTMHIEEQARQVKRVKRAESVMINEPISIKKDRKVADVLKMMQEYKIGGIPVVDDNESLIGIVTNRDLRFEKNLERAIEEVMTRDPIITTSTGTNLDEAAQILQKHKIEKLPVVNHSNKLIGLITYKDITKTKDRPNACKDDSGQLRVAAAVGIGKDAEERARQLIDAKVDALVIDTAHAHTESVFMLLKTLKKRFPDTEIVVGNIGTAKAARDLYNAGADAVKVGIGPGSICTTRVVAGVGIPQLSAILNIANELKNTDIPVIADGGIRYSGDIVKGLAAGANNVMVGSLLAGVEESPGETIIYSGRKFKAYRGMGSIEAMHEGSSDRYFQEEKKEADKLVPEGISARVPYKGTLAEVVYQLVGGVRSGMGYCGAKDINALQKAEFIRVSKAGIAESHPHDVTITREAPNYTRE